MNKFNLKIITPKGLYLNKEVEKLYLKTGNGFMTILANHVDYITNVEKSLGFIEYDNKKEYFEFDIGILSINKKENSLVIQNIKQK